MRHPRTLLGLLAAATLSFGSRASDVVVPFLWTATPGPANNSLPFNLPPPSVVRYQQVYAASDFLASGVVFPITITDLSFRPGQTVLSTSFELSGRTLTLSINLSDSAAGPDALSTNLASNVSGVATTVYSGPLPLPPIPSFAGAGPYPFVWTIPLQTPYVYTGTSDLLLDVAILSSTAPPGFFGGFLDAVYASGDAVSRMWDPWNPPGTFPILGDTLGLITRFHFGPSFATFGIGCAGAGGFVPSIGSTGGDPSLGNASFAITLANATGGSSALLALGASHISWLGVPLPIDLAPFGGAGCLLLASGDVLIGAPVSGSGAGGGTATVPTPIPASPSLSGGRAFAQWVPSEPILGGVRTSNAASVTVF